MGNCPKTAGYCTGPAGTAGSARRSFLNDGHTRRVVADCARWLAEETPLLGIGVKTVGTDGGLAGTFEDQRYPCYWYFHARTSTV
jgi:hypothetical protein